MALSLVYTDVPDAETDGSKPGVQDDPDMGTDDSVAGVLGILDSETNATVPGSGPENEATVNTNYLCAK